jgi:hypothetical protein
MVILEIASLRMFPGMLHPATSLLVAADRLQHDDDLGQSDPAGRMPSTFPRKMSA